METSNQADEQSPTSVALGYTIFYVDDVRATIDFYVAAFDLREKFVTPEGDYGELDTGATTLAFVSNTLAESNLSAAGGFSRIDSKARPVGMSITLVTPNLAETFEAAVAAGARRYVEPVDKSWGQSVAYVLDPNGALLELATPIQS